MSTTTFIYPETRGRGGKAGFGLSELEIDSCVGSTGNSRTIGIGQGLAVSGPEVDSCVISSTKPRTGFVREGTGAGFIDTVIELFILALKSSTYRFPPPGRLPNSVMNCSRHSCGPGSPSFSKIGRLDMISTSAQAMSKILTTYRRVKPRLPTANDLHTNPMPCTVMDCFENPLRAVTQSCAIFTGYPSVMDGCIEIDDRYVLEMVSCHNTPSNHCCEILKSTFWVSVRRRYAGNASAVCR